MNKLMMDSMNFLGNPAERLLAEKPFSGWRICAICRKEVDSIETHRDDRGNINVALRCHGHIEHHKITLAERVAQLEKRN